MASNFITQNLPTVFTSIMDYIRGDQPDYMMGLGLSVVAVGLFAVLGLTGYEWQQPQTLTGGCVIIVGSVLAFSKAYLWANWWVCIAGFALVAAVVALLWMGYEIGRGISQNPQQRNARLKSCGPPFIIFLLAVCLLCTIFTREEPRETEGSSENLGPSVHRAIEKIAEGKDSWTERAYAFIGNKQVNREGFQERLEGFSEFSVKDRLGRTPLMLAFELRLFDVAGWLLSNKHPRSSWLQALGETNCDGNSLTHIAARDGDIQALKWIAIKIEPWEAQALNAQPNSQKMRPIHIAAKHGRLGVLGYLTQQGVLLDELDSNGLTIGHHAARAGQVGVLRWINENGGWSQMSGLFRHIKGIAREAERSGQMGPLEYFYVQNRAIKFDAEDSEKQTIAMRAAASGNVRLLHWSSENGVDLKNEPSLSLLALSGNHSQCAAYLHTQHHLPDASDPRKVGSVLDKVPWDTMMGKTGVGVLRWLHEKFPNSPSVQPFYKKVMKEAGRRGHIQILEQVVNGCQVPIDSTTDEERHTIAHHAAYAGTISTFHWIFQQKGGYNLMNQANAFNHLPKNTCVKNKYPAFCGFLDRNTS